MLRWLLAGEGWMVRKLVPRVALITVRRLWWSAACARCTAFARI
jgi:hypothetical protein